MNWIYFSLYIISFIITCLFYELAYKKCRGSYKFLLKTKYAKIAFVCQCINFAIGMKFWLANLNNEIMGYIVPLLVTCLFALLLRFYYTYKICRKKKSNLSKELVGEI